MTDIRVVLNLEIISLSIEIYGKILLEAKDILLNLND
ncbi:hypothetical protein Q428_05390 [Fervidicella metallireducens AeB]|uniref:Uncharacterized protein n=1 Tax=Fervidicella metallireducens AeB TaxID=1403537 RepID=A0A017RW00_9CLOT|nr:hypothetical protein Q428_05390 [Fervidicella metallireducens AeB]